MSEQSRYTHLARLHGKTVTVLGTDRAGEPDAATVSLYLPAAARPARCPECRALRTPDHPDVIDFDHDVNCDLYGSEAEQREADCEALAELAAAGEVPMLTRLMTLDECRLAEEGADLDIPLEAEVVVMALADGDRVRYLR